jgi:hypothetical protein
MLRKMYDFSHLPEHWNIKDYAPGSRTQKAADPNEWGGGRVRRLLYAAYTIAFLCLLRFDEVLKIQVHDIEIVSPTCIKLTLPFRKTDPNGGEYQLCSMNKSKLIKCARQESNPFSYICYLRPMLTSAQYVHSPTGLLSLGSARDIFFARWHRVIGLQRQIHPW